MSEVNTDATTGLVDVDDGGLEIHQQYCDHCYCNTKYCLSNQTTLSSIQIFLHIYMPIEIHFHNVNNNYLILSVINPSQFLTM